MIYLSLTRDCKIHRIIKMYNSIKKVRVRENPSVIYFMKEYRTSAQWPVGNRDENKNELDYNRRMIDENSSKGTIAD